MTWILVPWTMGFVDDGNFTWFRRQAGAATRECCLHAGNCQLRSALWLLSVPFASGLRVL